MDSVRIRTLYKGYPTPRSSRVGGLTVTYLMYFLVDLVTVTVKRPRQ